jgi:DNA-binding LacI/PurR family transcriptional regulator
VVVFFLFVVTSLSLRPSELDSRGEEGRAHGDVITDLRKPKTKSAPGNLKSKGPLTVTLATIAQQVGLTAGTVSVVLNNAEASARVPEKTRKRILDAARELRYKPNFLARSLRVRRTHTVGVIAQEIGDIYGAMVISGVERYLREQNYFFLTVIHRHDLRLLHSYSELLLSRGAEGIITVDTSIEETPSVPTVAVAGHRRVDGVTNIVLDHRGAARMAFTHLAELGHRRIALMKGPPESSDTNARWEAICEAADELKTKIRTEFFTQVTTNSTPQPGYEATKELLTKSREFTALFAFNDLAAIGAIRAIGEAGLRVPADVSVIGFDDIPSAAYTRPSLTTVRQPLLKMGEIAARTLLEQIEQRSEYVPEIAIEPELVVRESTAKAPTRAKS